MIIKIFGYIIGVLSLIYFGTYAVLTGLTNKFTYFWLLLGIVCIVCASNWKRIHKLVQAIPTWLKILSGVIIGVCIVIFVAAEIIIISYGTAKPQANVDYVIVLGSQVRGRTPSYNLARRLDKAYEYLQENPQTTVILSGGQGDGEEITEAEAMAEYLEEKGIPKERMLLEDKSKDTYENIKFSRELMDSQDVQIVLVTNDFHIFRSIGIAKKQGLTNVEGLGAPVMWYTMPNMYVREAFAVIKYALCGQI